MLTYKGIRVTTLTEMVTVSLVLLQPGACSYYRSQVQPTKQEEVTIPELTTQLL